MLPLATVEKVMEVELGGGGGGGREMESEECGEREYE